VRLVVALGGNALLLRGESADIETQRANVSMAVSAIAQLARSHEVVVTHGNGPQVGLLALQSEMLTGVSPYPLDVLGAESEGMIGYLLEQELGNHLAGRSIVTLLTQVVVDAEDDAFENPRKPIGPVYDQDTAGRLARERGWSIAPDGESYRRVVPSPEPRAIVELGAVRLLVEAVIDKDLTAALLATQLGAQALLMLTDVANVEANWRTAHARPLTDATTAELRGLTFAPGSMGPKVEAACRFVEQTGGVAAIGALRDATRLLTGERGTRVTAG
jgi:carbamate kinase